MGWNDAHGRGLAHPGLAGDGGPGAGQYHVGMTLPILSLRRLLNGMAAGDLRASPELPVTMPGQGHGATCGVCN